VHREYPRVRKAGAELVFVGNGNRHFARAFRDELGIKAPIYVDTQRGAYAALGMRRGFGATVGSLAAVKNAARALRTRRHSLLTVGPCGLGGSKWAEAWRRTPPRQRSPPTRTNGAQ